MHDPADDRLKRAAQALQSLHILAASRSRFRTFAGRWKLSHLSFRMIPIYGINTFRERQRGTAVKRFSDLTEQEVLALAITNEEEDSRIYRGFAEGLREQFPCLRQGIRRDGGRGSAPPHDAVRSLPEEVRRLSAADPPPGREGLPAPEAAAVADAAARARGGAQVRREHGVRGRALLPQGGGKRARRLGAATADRACGSRSRPREPRAQAQPGNSHQGRARQGRRDRAAHVRAAICAAGPRRADGRLGIDAGAAVRGRLRDAQHLGRPFWSAWRPRSAPASRWALPKRCPTTARSPAAARRGCAARCAA